jgi:hypothetical protein
MMRAEQSGISGRLVLETMLGGVPLRDAPSRLRYGTVKRDLFDR